MKMLQKFKLAIKREVLIYIVMLLVLTFVMHNDILNDPAARFGIMVEKGNYFHPILYTFVIYSIIFILKNILDFILDLFEKKDP